MSTDSKPFVDVSMTTISSRIHTLDRTVASLLAQDYPNFRLFIHISRTPHLLDQGIPDVPRALLDLRRQYSDLLEIRYVPNTGSYRKLLPLLTSRWRTRALIVTADDDTLYPSDWLSTLVSHYERLGCIICYRGHHMAREGGRFLPYRRWMTHGIESNPDIFTLPTGKDGVLYSSAGFHPGVLNIRRALELAPTADDLWIRWHTAALGIPVYCIEPDYRSSFSDLGGADDGLYSHYNRAGQNDKAIDALCRYGRDRLGFDFPGFNHLELMFAGRKAG